MAVDASTPIPATVPAVETIQATRNDEETFVATQEQVHAPVAPIPNEDSAPVASIPKLDSAPAANVPENKEPHVETIEQPHDEEVGTSSQRPETVAEPTPPSVPEKTPQLPAPVLVQERALTAAPQTASGPTAESDRTVEGLAAALTAAGHEMGQADREHLRREIKNEKAYEKALHKEAKSDSNAIKAAILQAKASVSALERKRREIARATRLMDEHLDEQRAAEKKLLRAEDRLKAANAAVTRASKELELLQVGHNFHQEKQIADAAEVERLRHVKASNDMAREVKHADNLVKLSQAKRALATAGGNKNRFLCC